MRALAVLATLCLALTGSTARATAPPTPAPGTARTAPAPRAVPAPTPTTSVVTVRTGGDRTGDSEIGPLPGVRLQLAPAATPTDPVDAPWAECTADADGDCSFVVPGTGSGGANRDQRFVVSQVSAPAGWFVNDTLRTGNGSGSTSFSSPYRFETPGLRGGNTYRSTAEFMHGTDYGTSPYLASSGIWQQSRVNPPLPRDCGLDVALLLDLSASVGSALPQLKAAANTFTDALTGTPSRLSVFSFDGDSPSTGTTNHPEHHSVSTPAGADSFKALYRDWELGKGTNWDQGLYAVAKARQRYDAVVVLTDGNPTYWNNPREGGGSNTAFADVEGGIFAANAVKAKGTRVVALGVGRGVQGVSGLNLRALSGPEPFDGDNTTTADYYQTTDFGTAAQALHDLALTHCDGSLSVVKQIVPAGNEGEDVDGSVNAGEGWEFNASTATPGVTGLPATETTSEDGTGAVLFRPVYPPTVPSAAVDVTETQRPGHVLVTQGGKNADCTNLDTGDPVPVTNSGASGFQVDVPRLEAISCVVYNRPPPTADVTADKEWRIDGRTYAHDDRPDGFDATLTLTGPGDEGPTPQEWGTPRPGYGVGQDVTLDERTTLPEGCVLRSARVVREDGEPADARLPHTAQVTTPHATYVVRNTVSCGGTLTLVKHVVNEGGGSAVPSEWVLRGRGPELVEGVSGSPDVTGVRVPAGDYTLTESGGPEGYDSSLWECAGRRGTLPTADGRVTVAPGDRVRCVITNTWQGGPTPSPTPTPTPAPTPTVAPSATGAPGQLANTGDRDLERPGPGLFLAVAAAVLLAAGLGFLAVRRRLRH